MKTDLASTFPPLASHPPPERKPGLLHAAEPPISIVAARSDSKSEPVSPGQTQDFHLVRDLALFVRVLRRADGGRWVMAIFVASIAVTGANMFWQVQLNKWKRQFFDALGRKEVSAFIYLLWTFLGLITVLLALTVAQTFLQQRLKFRLREWISRHLLDEWLKPMRSTN